MNGDGAYISSSRGLNHDAIIVLRLIITAKGLPRLKSIFMEGQVLELNDNLRDIL